MSADNVIRRNSLVDSQHNPDAPEPPGIGIGIRLAASGERPVFRKGTPILVHGAYSADQDLIAQCSEGLGASILVTIIRLDKPWGETTRLITPLAQLSRPQPPDEPYRESYRQIGHFKMDLVKFFVLPQEPGRYRIETHLGAYHSQRLEFTIQ